ncbi:MAG: peptidoglycan editing factor PgeF [Pseudomonadales bacterium]
MTGWLDAQWPYGDRVRALTTTREDGHSTGVYARFNLATHVGDDPAAVRANRRDLDALLGGMPVQWLEQVHGTAVVQATRDGVHTVPEADGAWTGERGLVLAVLTADCLPVVLVDDRCRNLAIVHAGWRGLVSGVIAAGCAALPFRPRAAWLGPAIGPDAYEVGADVLQAVARLPVRAEDAIRPSPQTGKGYLDLHRLAERLLSREGVTEVYGVRACTYTDPRFYSYRRVGETGRMATLAWLRP